MNSLGELSDPILLNEPLEIGGWDHEILIKMYREMAEIRAVEYCIADLIKKGIAKCPCHLSIGQEAIPVGISEFLSSKDKCFGNHRSHGHYLALGGSSQAMISEIFGKKTGCSGGMGGSMHLISKEDGFLGSVPIVAGTVPIAVGSALAAKMDQSNHIVVTYFGDGAMEEGSVHESMNLASTLKLPIIFVCENNFYSSHLDILQRQPSEGLSRFAEAHMIEYRVVDGNDVLDVAKNATELIQRARLQREPGFIEAVTYRHCGHVGANEDIDVGVRRKAADLKQWKGRDPIKRLGDALDQAKILTCREQKNIYDELETRLVHEVQEAKSSPYPEQDALLDCVFSQEE